VSGGQANRLPLLIRHNIQQNDTKNKDTCIITLPRTILRITVLIMMLTTRTLSVKTFNILTLSIIAST
jgi:hypothetical protein